MKYVQDLNEENCKTLMKKKLTCSIFLDWKTQYCKDINSLQLDKNNLIGFFTKNPIKNISKFFFYEYLQIASKVYM